MRSLLWTITALVAVLGCVGVIASFNYRASHLGLPIRIMPSRVRTTQQSPEESKYRVRDRVFHNDFGHGTVVATDGPKLTIEFDDGRVKRVLDDFVVRGNEGPAPN